MVWPCPGVPAVEGSGPTLGLHEPSERVSIRGYVLYASSDTEPTATQDAGDKQDMLWRVDDAGALPLGKITGSGTLLGSPRVVVGVASADCSNARVHSPARVTAERTALRPFRTCFIGSSYQRLRRNCRPVATWLLDVLRVRLTVMFSLRKKISPSVASGP
jgi:hypothetical protein